MVDWPAGCASQRIAEGSDIDRGRRSFPIAFHSNGRDSGPAAHRDPCLAVERTAHDIFSGAAVIVIVTSIGVSVNAPDLPLLRSLFDLSPAEAKLAAALASGRTLKEAAKEAKVRFSTARSYMESVFRKTGTHRQSQLVALLKSTQQLRPN